jgi:hypothetical protein
MDNKIIYTAKFTHHDLKFHKGWWKSNKRCGSWYALCHCKFSYMINQKFMKLGTLQDPNMKMCTLVVYPGPSSFPWIMSLKLCYKYVLAELRWWEVGLDRQTGRFLYTSLELSRHLIQLYKRQQIWEQPVRFSLNHESKVVLQICFGWIKMMGTRGGISPG